MSLDSFIPTIWSARLLENLHAVTVYASVCNREYEGEITGAGASVKINAIGTVNVGDYVKNTDINAPETLADSQSTLVVDQAKFFNFQIDDVDRAQQKPKVMDAAMREASYALRLAEDTYIGALHSHAGSKLGTDASAIVIDNSGTAGRNAYENLVDLGVLLDEKSIPAEGRWCIVPPWFHGLLLKDERFVSFGTDQNLATLRNGRVGTAAGFMILKAPLVPNTNGAKYKIMAGNGMAITLAEQIMSVEAYRPQLRFGDAVKGLMVYGAKVVRPEALAVLTASKS